MNESQFTPTRILVYGIEPDLQLTRKMLLTGAGYVVDLAADGEEYRARLRRVRESYKLVVVCHTLPDDEWETSSQLARAENIRVMALREAIAPSLFLSKLAELIAI